VLLHALEKFSRVLKVKISDVVETINFETEIWLKFHDETGTGSSSKVPSSGLVETVTSETETET